MKETQDVMRLPGLSSRENRIKKQDKNRKMERQNDGNE